MLNYPRWCDIDFGFSGRIVRRVGVATDGANVRDAGMLVIQHSRFIHLVNMVVDIEMQICALDADQSNCQIQYPEQLVAEFARCVKDH